MLNMPPMPAALRLSESEERACLDAQEAIHRAADWLFDADQQDAAQVATRTPNLWPLDFLSLPGVADRLDWRVVQQLALGVLALREDRALLRAGREHAGAESGWLNGYLRRWERRRRWRQ